ncbi:MAG: dockerin type I domain-containing protein, partial [Ruminiclostridium sp.]
MDGNVDAIDLAMIKKYLLDSESVSIDTL